MRSAAPCLSKFSIATACSGAAADQLPDALEARQEKGIAAVQHGFRSSFRDWASERTNNPGEVVEAALARWTFSTPRRRCATTMSWVRPWSHFLIPVTVEEMAPSRGTGSRRDRKT